MAERTGQSLNADKELGILIPEQTITIQGEKIVVHELTFKQGLELSGAVSVLVNATLDRLAGFQDKLPESYFDELQQVFAEHLGAMQHVMSASCNRPIEWVEGLNDADGQLLLMATWLVNKDFFFRRLGTKAALMGQARAASASAKSGLH